MTGEQKVILVILGVLLLLCVIVGASLNHHIGGFLETVAREEEQERAEAERHAHKNDTGE